MITYFYNSSITLYDFAQHTNNTHYFLAG